MITFEKGTKVEGDRKVFINGHQITFIEYAEAGMVFFQNEDLRYPPSKGLLGGQMLINFLQDCYNAGSITDEILKKYKLGRYKP